MYCRDVNLKFKNYMIEKRKEHGLTQKQVADGIGLSRGAYQRLEAIDSTSTITLEQTGLIFDFYAIDPAGRLIAYLDSQQRRKVEVRIIGVEKLLETIMDGKFYYEDLQKQAQNLHDLYAIDVVDLKAKLKKIEERPD